MLKAIERIIMDWAIAFLERREFVVFWLDEGQRECRNGVCWLHEYKNARDAAKWGDDFER